VRTENLFPDEELDARQLLVGGENPELLTPCRVDRFDHDGWIRDAQSGFERYGERAR